MAGSARTRRAGSALMHPGCHIEQVYLCREPIDFRKSIGGLSVLVEQELELNPFGSALYVFVNRQRNKIKALYWHRNGFCLWYKRLESEKFAWPRDGSAATQTVSMQEFEWLLEGFDLWRNQPHKTLYFDSVS
jgi:transposase